MADFTVIETDRLEQVASTADLEGERVGAEVSIIFVDMAPAASVRLHRHQYQEIFIVQEGRATYTIGDTTVEIEAPRVVVVGPAVPHAFTNSGDGHLKQVDIHVSPRIVTEWL
ncbi:MAG TPA: cupin domain-containing protein [Candidatus Dormibacteraeota bacterium]|jgi:mannose-6-phosphate isomerase-like protein (cupin superfamily)